LLTTVNLPKIIDIIYLDVNLSFSTAEKVPIIIDIDFSLIEIVDNFYFQIK
jgi:hypothetical protein